MLHRAEIHRLWLQVPRILSFSLLLLVFVSTSLSCWFVVIVSNAVAVVLPVGVTVSLNISRYVLLSDVAPSTNICMCTGEKSPMFDDGDASAVSQ